MSNLRTIKELCDDLRRGRTWVHGVKAAAVAGAAPGSVICPDISEMRIAAHRAGLAGKSDREIALEMQCFIGKEQARLGQTVPNHWYGFELTAQWLEWFAVDSKNAEELLQYAQNQRRLAEDMKARPDYYAQRDSGQYTHWQWFQLSAPNAELSNPSRK